MAYCVAWDVISLGMLEAELASQCMAVLFLTARRNRGALLVLLLVVLH